jgi:adenine-specific DNA-methyltransferase
MIERAIKEKINFKHPYLTKQIIAYIGNKRRLLPLIYEALKGCQFEKLGRHVFLDLFAGSGVVSRFAKYMNFHVISNDWEYYTYLINKPYLEIHERDLSRLFREHGGMENILRELNNLQGPPIEDQFIAQYYSPSDDDIESLDFRKERMFYTKENGLIIDKIRNRIEDLYPEETINNSDIKRREKYLLIALLLYESATHTNTSGVFKAYHKGFGGHNRDALSRILAPISLKQPVLINSDFDAEVYCEDAFTLVNSEKLRRRNIDIVYVDPPYNQHQYGSNYHLLNTIGRWDKPVVTNELNEKGVLKHKAAIRKDWVVTRSDYCYRDRAQEAFARLLQSIDAKHILLSYSTEGIIPFDVMMAMCAEKGEIDIVTNEYTKYRGGKQSINRLNRNIEFVMIIHTGRKNTKKTINKIDCVLSRKRLGLLLRKKYTQKKLKQNFTMSGDGGSIQLPGSDIVLLTRNYFELIPSLDIEALSTEEVRTLIDRLEKSVCIDKEEELQEIMRIIRGGGSDREYFVKLIPDTLKKFAHKKYKKTFNKWLYRVKSI